MKQITFEDDKSKKPIFANKEKNELLLYWKNSYIKELEERVFKEKNKILQKKLDGSDPYDKHLDRRRNERTKYSMKTGINNFKGSSKANNMYSNNFPRVKLNIHSNTNLRKNNEPKNKIP